MSTFTTPGPDSQPGTGHSARRPIEYLTDTGSVASSVGQSFPVTDTAASGPAAAAIPVPAGHTRLPEADGGATDATTQGDPVVAPGPEAGLHSSDSGAADRVSGTARSAAVAAYSASHPALATYSFGFRSSTYHSRVLPPVRLAPGRPVTGVVPTTRDDTHLRLTGPGPLSHSCSCHLTYPVSFS